MTSNRIVAVYGAYGHTGRFVVAELVRRGWTPVLSGRDARKLRELGTDYPALEQRPASLDDPAALDRVLDGAGAVIHCAGPFLDTAAPMIEAALRAGIGYLDLSAEQQAVLDAFAHYADAARNAGVAVLPGMAFYGGLADLLATSAMGDWPEAEAIDVAVALDRWHPTPGTRLTGQRNHYPRQMVSGSRLAVLAQPSPKRQWAFPAPFGIQPMVELPFSETITISRHLRTRELHSHINLSALEDVRHPDTPAPVGTDATGRSSQRFAMQVHVRNGGQTRSAAAYGRDIYAFTAPLVVEAMERVVTGRHLRSGVLAAGEAFDAPAFLAALAPEHLELA